MILSVFNPDEVYSRLKRLKKRELTCVKDNVEIYFKETYKDKLVKITETIKFSTAIKLVIIIGIDM